MQECKWVLDIANRQLSKMLVLTRDGLVAHSRITARFRHVSYFNNNICHKGAISRIGLQMYWSMDQVLKYIPRYKEEKEITDETSS